MSTPGKCVYWQQYRGFESLPVRHQFYNERSPNRERFLLFALGVWRDLSPTEGLKTGDSCKPVWTNVLRLPRRVEVAKWGNRINPAFTCTIDLFFTSHNQSRSLLSSIFRRNIFVMNILRYLFVGMGKKWGKGRIGDFRQTIISNSNCIGKSQNLDILFPSMAEE